LIEIINKQLLLQLVGYLCYWQMGFNSVFKGLIFEDVGSIYVTQDSVQWRAVLNKGINLRIT